MRSANADNLKRQSTACGRFWRLFLIAALVVGAAFIDGRAEKPPVRSYRVADGLLRDTVNKIKQDSRGFLWICTAEGVSRFDGYGFKNFTVADGLPGGAINDFLETRAGVVYLATDQGLARLNPVADQNSPPTSGSAVQTRGAGLFKITAPAIPAAKAIRVLFEDDGGAVWVGTTGGLFRLNAADGFDAVDLGESKTAEKGISVTAIVKDRRGALWIGTHGGGLFRLRADGAVSQFATADGLPGNFIASLLEDRAGNLWAGMRWDWASAGLARLNPDAGAEGSDSPIVARAFTTDDGLPANWIPSMLESRDGKLWLGTVGGLCEWRGENQGKVCRNYTAENDLCGRDVWSLAEDRDGNLWTGSACGAQKIARYGFTTYGASDGIEETQPNSIFENRRGEFFVSTAQSARVIYRLGADGKFSSVRPLVPNVKYFGWGIKQTVWQDAEDSWLVPTGGGLYKYAPGTKFEDLAAAEPQKFSPATKGAEVFRLFEDSRGDVWMATTSGASELWRWQRGARRWQDFSAQIIQTQNRLITSFAEDKSGNVWIGTGADDGAQLIRFRDGRFTTFTENDGLPGGWIRDLYVDHLGRLWLANNKNGVMRVDDVDASARLDLVRYATADGLASVGAYCIVEDNYDRIYIGSARGVDRLSPESGQVENFTTADGLPASSVETSYRDRQNNLWFGTAKGLTKFIPEPTGTGKPPSILITGLRAGGEPRAVSLLGESEVAKIELDAAQRQVSVDFVGLGASLGEQLKYEYRLGNSEWTKTTERTVNFANLAAGDYRFEVRAVSADRIISPQPAVVSFNIAAPFYFRAWFVALAAAAAAAAVFAIYRYRLNKLLEIERTRTRIATDLHDDIGTNLSKISLLSEIVNLQLAEQNKDSKNLLRSIAEISRESVSSMSDIVWAIDPQRDSFSALVRRMRLHAEEIFLEREVAVAFDAPDSAEDSLRLSMNARRELYLIFKEALSNAARHSHCSRVEIEMRAEAGFVFLRISDDGEGFAAGDRHDGNGLPNMKNRAEKTGGKFAIESAPNGGTTLKIHFPID